MKNVEEDFRWSKVCLALDLATATGWAYNSSSGFLAGTEVLAGKKEISEFAKDRRDRRDDPRVSRLWTFLRRWTTIDYVVFEDVEFSSSTKQVQLWSSFRAAMWIAIPGAHFEAVPVGTLKKFAGHGSATKEMMAKFLVKQYPERFALTPRGQVFDRIHGRQLDDNAVDAIWLWLWAKKNLGRI